MPADEPSNWDINRRLSDLEGDHRELARKHNEDMRDIHQSYLRNDLWNEARKADASVVANVIESVKGVKTRLDADDAFRRQVWFGLSITALTSVISIAVAVITALVR